MNREELKELGLSDEQIDKVMVSHGKVVNSTKQELETVEGERDSLKKQLTERDNQLNDLSDKVKDSEELTAEINRLKEENKAATKEMQQKLDKQAFDFGLERELINANVHNPKAVKALLDVDQIKLDGDKLLGLETQLEGLKESDPYLFKGEDNQSNIFAGGNPNGGQGITKNPFSKEHWNLTEQGRLFKENPTLYKNLKSQVGK